MDEPEGAWMTKAELAHVRGISVASAYRLIRRQGWRRQPGNDGKVRVLVPSDWAEARDADRTDGPTDRPLTNPSDTDLFVSLIEAANVRADEAHKRADAALALADRTMAQLAEAGGRADRLERDLANALTLAELARAQAQAAQEAAEELRREIEAGKARGRWARVRAAWRGE